MEKWDGEVCIRMILWEVARLRAPQAILLATLDLAHRGHPTRAGAQDPVSQGDRMWLCTIQYVGCNLTHSFVGNRNTKW